MTLDYFMGVVTGIGLGVASGILYCVHAFGGPDKPTRPDDAGEWEPDPANIPPDALTDEFVINGSEIGDLSYGELENTHRMVLTTMNESVKIDDYESAIHLAHAEHAIRVERFKRDRDRDDERPEYPDDPTLEDFFDDEDFDPFGSGGPL